MTFNELIQNLVTYDFDFNIHHSNNNTMLNIILGNVEHDVDSTNEARIEELWKDIEQYWLPKRMLCINTTTFDNLCERSWGEAISTIVDNLDNIGQILRADLKILCEVYYKAYETQDYLVTYDANYGLTFEIRKFAVEQIRKLLENS